MRVFTPPIDPEIQVTLKTSELKAMLRCVGLVYAADISVRHLNTRGLVTNSLAEDAKQLLGVL